MSENIAIPEAPVNEPVTIINAFSMPPQEAERFLELWQDNAAAMSAPRWSDHQPPYRAASVVGPSRAG
ncbi:hypothetical protein [Nocardia sp. NPDC052566]|uniref:hypothetical protein n=1 Tax=Nocardia sp. NPDC052566 TaxID=3364330 RepID=UPI0037C76425